MARIVHTLVVRNYPAVTVEELMDLILMESMTETVASVLEAAGLRTGPTSP
ncbi:MAG: hypothetical protein IPL34_20525 [Thiofilum sp.]|uniref:hypothetical protein n=1 Tax=Thiofilum sp. TaxID=2212733 RepID=UPI0025DBC1A2|nr:hypothetical protein [Thiofilum sp.]MBK8455669.1 hypothetical protein [Thiofilum sp.]